MTFTSALANGPQQPFYEDELVTLYLGDCTEVMRGMRDNSVDAVVTDPPYGLEFMGKEWDGADGFRRSLNATDVGRDNAFGRTSRTSPEYRTTASRAQASSRQEGGIRQASGPSHMGGLNPKCLLCDKWQRGSNPCSCDAPQWTQERLVRLHSFQEWCAAWSTECLRVLKPGGHLLAFGGSRTWHRLACAVEDAGFEVRDSIAWLYGSGFPKSLNLAGEWKGWGTALKPAFEPVVVARKPLRGTVAANMTEYSTGALNIDACRVPGVVPQVTQGAEDRIYGGGKGLRSEPTQSRPHEGGRWPANVVLDQSQADDLDRQSGVLTSGKESRDGHVRRGDANRTVYGGYDGQAPGDSAGALYGDSGGASRFFPTFRYEAKAPSAERPRDGDVAHPTVKPLDLMRWLVRLVTPPGGTVLEPFAGSGTTAEACVIEGFRCLAIEREETYIPLIVARLTKPIQPDMFGGAA